jgi:hypothetical protein
MDYMAGVGVRLAPQLHERIVVSKQERRQLLREAEVLVNGKRAQAYGEPVDNFRRIGNLWTAYLDGKTEVDEVDAAIMQALIKVARIRETRDHWDSWVDLAGYAASGWSAAVDSD